MKFMQRDWLVAIPLLFLVNLILCIVGFSSFILYALCEKI